MINIKQDEIRKRLWLIFQNFHRELALPYDHKELTLVLLFLKCINDKYFDNIQLIKESSFDYLVNNSKIPGNFERIKFAFSLFDKENKMMHLKSSVNIFQNISFETIAQRNLESFDNVIGELIEDIGNLELDTYKTNNLYYEFVGSTYEYLIQQYSLKQNIKQNNDYTPPQVSDLIAKIVDPLPNELVNDPACGSASLLMKCQRGNSKIYGQEYSDVTCLLAKLNLILHGISNCTIEQGDTIFNPKLLNPDNELIKFDISVSNPQFNIVNRHIHSDAYRDFIRDKQYNRFDRGLLPKSRDEYSFICHMLATLKDDTGRMAIVVPQGVLFRGIEEGDIRKQLIEENLLDTVIELPGKLLYSNKFSSIILIFKKNKSDNKVLFIDASSEFLHGKKHNTLSDENISKIVTTYKERASLDSFSYLATLKEIHDKNYNLNMPLYVDGNPEAEDIDIESAIEKRQSLKNQLMDINKKIEEQLKYFE